MSNAILSEATAAFVAGWTAIKRLTGPFEVKRLGKAYLAFDPTGRRRAELIGAGQSSAELVGEAAGETGRIAISAIHSEGDDLDARNEAFRKLGWRLLATEGLFVHELKDLPPSDSRVRRARTAVDVARVAKVLRRRPASLGVEDIDDAAIRLYEANVGGKTVGWVKSVQAGADGWVADLKVLEPHRRKGLGRALMAALLADDARLGRRRSVLLASHAGAMLYPTLGYRRIGTLMLLMPITPSPPSRRSGASAGG
jgi:GNAT superfamily N-acetyltransferase